MVCQAEMARNFHHQFPKLNMENSLSIVESQLRECYGRTVYSHKTHEKCADILLAQLSAIKLWQIILSAITTGSFLTTIISSTQVATILLALNAYTKNYDLGELAQKHKQAANDIWLVREQYLSLLTDLAAGTKAIEEIQSERDRLVTSLHTSYAGSPSTTSDAYRRAQEAIKENEEMTFSDTEIDALLPKHLKRGG
jgi:SMODS and SLOG-associating 2TM effector domain family 4